MIARTVTQIVNHIAKKNSVLNDSKSSILVPIAEKKIKMALDRVKLKSTLFSARDIDLLTTEVYKESLYTAQMELMPRLEEPASKPETAYRRQV